MIAGPLQPPPHHDVEVESTMGDACGSNSPTADKLASPMDSSESVVPHKLPYMSTSPGPVQPYSVDMTLPDTQPLVENSKRLGHDAELDRRLFLLLLLLFMK